MVGAIVFEYEHGEIDIYNLYGMFGTGDEQELDEEALRPRR